jgi:hypothetical protein
MIACVTVEGKLRRGALLGFVAALAVVSNASAAPPNQPTLDNATVQENQPAGTVVGTLSSSDPDGGTTFTYKLVAGTGDTDNGKFKVVGDKLTTRQVLDYEALQTASVRVRVTDALNENSRSVFSLQITNDTSDDPNHPPTNVHLSNHSVAENQPSGTTVGSLASDDPDLGDSFTYSLVPGSGSQGNASFTINGSTLKTSAVFDYEAKKSYSIRVQTADGQGHTFAKAFTITVTDVVDTNHAPTDITFSNLSVPENSASGAEVGTPSTTDQDAGDTFTYTLVSGTGDGDNASFAMVGDKLKTSAVFDFETKSQYSVRVQTSDGHGGTFAKAVTVTVTDVADTNEPPVLAGIEAANFAYTEQDAGVQVTNTITVADVDDTPMKSADVRIGAGLQSGDELLFTNQNGIIGSYANATGILTLAGTSSVTDYQAALRSIQFRNLTNDNPTNGNATPTRTVAFKVNDGDVDSNTQSRSGSITAVNDAPVNTMPAGPNGFEDTDLTISNAGSISVADIDAGAASVKVTLAATNGTMTLDGTIGLSFNSGDGAADGTMTFTGTTVNINFALDGMTFRASPNYGGPASIAVTTNDQGNTGGPAASDSDILNINVTPVNDAPVNTVPVTQTGTEDVAKVFSLANGNPITVADVEATTLKVTLTADHATVTLATAADLTISAGADGSSTVTFTGTPAAINTALNGLSFRGDPNYNVDSGGDNTLTILTRDEGQTGAGGPLTDNDVIQINLSAANDQPTNIALSASSVAENQPSGTTVGNLSATDSDGLETFTYSLAAGTGDDDNASFSIVGNALKTAAAFDFETKSSYSVRAQTDDGHGGTFQKAFTVTVTNVNEAPTDIAMSNTTVDENQPSGTTVGNLFADDPDAGDTHAWSLVTGTGDDDNASFQIAANTLKTAAVFSYAAKDSYSIRVRATDVGNATFEKQFTISINDPT